MPINKEDEVFQGKTFSDLMKDIYTNQDKKSAQITLLVTELKNFIKSTSDAAMIVPLIKDYLDIGVRNDEQLIKLAAIFQKMMSSENRNELVARTGIDGTGGVLLTEDEKAELHSVAKEMEEYKAKKKIKEERIFDIDEELGAQMKNIKDEVSKMTEVKPSNEEVN